MALAEPIAMHWPSRVRSQYFTCLPQPPRHQLQPLSSSPHDAGINILLVSRTESKLQTAAAEIESKFKVQTKTVSVGAEATAHATAFFLSRSVVTIGGAQACLTCQCKIFVCCSKHCGRPAQAASARQSPDSRRSRTPPVLLLQVPINFGSASKEDWARLEATLSPLEVSNALHSSTGCVGSCVGSVPALPQEICHPRPGSTLPGRSLRHSMPAWRSIRGPVLHQSAACPRIGGDSIQGACHTIVLMLQPVDVVQPVPLPHDQHLAELHGERLAASGAGKDLPSLTLGSV